MIFKGHGVVWDAERSKVLCKFEKGELETEDKRTIDILVKLGYEHEGVVDDGVQEGEEETEEVEIEDKIDLNEKTVSELREIAKLAGYTGIYSKTKDELINMIEGD
jgi:hypothetical protein